MHVIGLFILVAASEMLNGIARTVLLKKRVGVTKAKRIALLPALALCLLICHYYVPSRMSGPTWDCWYSVLRCPSSWGCSMSRSAGSS